MVEPGPARLRASPPPVDSAGPQWRNGRRGRLKLGCPRGRGSSTLPFGTRNGDSTATAFALGHGAPTPRGGLTPWRASAVSSLAPDSPSHGHPRSRSGRDSGRTVRAMPVVGWPNRRRARYGLAGRARRDHEPDRAGDPRRGQPAARRQRAAGGGSTEVPAARRQHARGREARAMTQTGGMDGFDD